MIYTMPGLNLNLNAESIEANPRRELNIEKKFSKDSFKELIEKQWECGIHD